MKETNDLLIEIGTEELPPKALPELAAAFAKGIEEGLTKASLSLQGAQWFATPRRIAVIVSDLETQQPDIENSRRGPAFAAAFDDDGKPTPAALGFAKSCGVEVDTLETHKTDKGEWLSYTIKEKGKQTKTLIPDIANQVLSRLPIPKRMRWGNSEIEFIRPIHWTVALFGDQLIPCELLAVKTDRCTYGHRFHHPEAIDLKTPAEYQQKLEKTGKVIADFNQRRELIRKQINDAAKKTKGIALIDPDLLDEVTALVEWPVAITGNFEKKYLKLPPEVLIATMQDNQKYFPVTDKKQQLLNAFIAISNIDSSDSDIIRKGNERVIRPRLSDAEFFWQRDTNHSLENYQDELADVVFQQELGTLADKTARIIQLAAYIADKLETDSAKVKRAAHLCKCDLLTDMVGEFPELQGTMGKYYALHSGEPKEVAHALEEQYMPKQAGAVLPQSECGRILAIADKLDTLAGLFGIGQQPTGDKDPFGLRRAALGIIRILIECNIQLSLQQLVSEALAGLNNTVEGAHTDLENFIYDRLSGYMKTLGYTALEIEAVIYKRPDHINLIPQQLEAVRAFNKLPEAESLVAANKRVVNILKQAEAKGESFIKVNPDMLQETAERNLFDALNSTNNKATKFFEQGNYIEYLNSFAVLKTPVDDFFDSVMVMVDEPKLRENRLAMLADLREAMNKVADVSRLQG